MKIKIDDDVFEIAKRIKEIDDGYYIVFDTKKEVYELHNSKQVYSYCLTVPYTNLDSRLLDMVLYTNISNIDNIINDIDNNNASIERNTAIQVKDYTNFMVKEIYDFCNNSSKQYINDNFKNMWR